MDKKEKEKENDLDKIFGMNRTMFFVIVILVCVLSVSIGIYASAFYKYSPTDPFILGVGVSVSQAEQEITQLKNNFPSSFNNGITGTTTVENVKKLDNSINTLVYTIKTISKKDDVNNMYNINVNIPKINLSSSNTDRINSQISRDFSDKVDYIMDSTGVFYEYSVNYMAYLNGEMLSLIINETEKEGNNVQTTKIYTYNINLRTNENISINDIINAKRYSNKEIQEGIEKEIKELNKSDEELKKNFPDKNITIRDVNNDIYKVENTKNFIVDAKGYLYIIYAYGNTSKTTKMDVVIFE